MRVGIDPIKPRKGLFDYKVYEREIKEAGKDVAETVVKQLERATNAWEHKPDFDTRMTVVAGGIAFDVFPVGPNKQIFIWVDNGTRRHWVAPVKAGALAFQRYRPHTRPGGGYGGYGSSYGPVMFSKGHYVSGIEPREFTRLAADAAAKPLSDAVRDAIREAGK